jgi:hypothetical protein
MNAITDPLTALQESQAAAVAARDNLAAVSQRAATAKAELAAAKETRKALVMRLANGGAITPAEHRTAEDAVKAAESTGMLLQDAVSGAAAAVAFADENVRLAMKAEGDRRFATAKERRLQLAAELEQLGKDYSAKAAEFMASGQEIHAAWALGRVPRSDEITSMRDRRPICVSLSADVQTVCIQNGTVVQYPLAARERAVWGDAPK